MGGKLIKERNPLYVFIRSTFLLLLGFYSPIFTIFGVMIGSYTINRISAENNMNAYSSDASCREFSLLIHTTWRAFWNICLQLFLCFVVIAIGCYYNMKWTQLFKAILGKELGYIYTINSAVIDIYNIYLFLSWHDCISCLDS